MVKANAGRGKSVRRAVAGLGWSSQTAILPEVEYTGDSEAALVADHKIRARNVGRRYGIDRVCSYDQLGDWLQFGQIDAAYLANPNLDLRPYRSRRPDPAQAQKLKVTKEPELIEVHRPSGGQ